MRLLLVALLIAGCGKSSPVSQPDWNLPEPTAEPQHVWKGQNVDEYLKEFKADEAKFNAKYSGKTIIVKGEFEFFFDSPSIPIIMIRTNTGPGEWHYAKCQFLPRDGKKLALLSRDTWIAAQGIYAGVADGELGLTDCKIVQRNR